MKTICPISLVLPLLLPLAASAQFNYDTNSGGLSITITGYTGSGGSVTIPAATNGLPITGIAAFAFFFDQNVTNVTIPANITNIGEAPFDDCQGLKAISVNPTNLYYSSAGGVLFNETQTTLIQYPCGTGGVYTVASSVTNIGYSAFLGATLTAISVSPENLNYSSINGVLYNYAQTMLLQCPAGASGSYTVPAGVASIATAAFEYCVKLASVSISASVTSIGGDAFYDASS
jgi:hypothetical protein